MPFTTLQDRALVIPRQPVPGCQYTRAKFQIGEVHRILPPVGHHTINCQGIDIPPEGKKLQITKELVTLIQAGFVRIAHDITNPGADKPSASPSVPPASNSTEGNTSSLATASVGVSPRTIEGVEHAPSTLLSAEGISSCEDREKLRLFVLDRTGVPNLKAPIEGIRELALRLFNEPGQFSNAAGASGAVVMAGSRGPT
jgi:hypothetical protein